ncbi:MAG: GTPase [Planctomycetota bacterium]
METIVALSSPPGPAARAVIRLSGPRALEIGASLCGVPRPSCRTAVRGAFTACGAQAPVLLLAMPAPRSYTREDVAEMHLPGAAPIVAEALRRALAAGARHALPGEFTRRAYENGRLSLAQAEAVMSVIRAGDDASLRLAAERLAGKGGRALDAASDLLSSLVADVEASIDFIEHDVPCVGREEVIERVAALAERLSRAGSGAAPADDAPRVVLAGPPNAGKTSLFNALTGARGLVSPLPGTTRDALEADLVLGYLLVRISDAPGDAPCEPGPDAEAASRGRSARDRADIVLHLRDGSRPFNAPALDPARELLVITKADLGSALSESKGLAVSALTGAGIPRLRARIALLARRRAGESDSVLSAREREATRRATDALERARRAAADVLGEEFIALELREALDALGEAVGVVSSEEVLDRVFARFCIGK